MAGECRCQRTMLGRGKARGRGSELRGSIEKELRAPAKQPETIWTIQGMQNKRLRKEFSKAYHSLGISARDVGGFVFAAADAKLGGAIELYGMYEGAEMLVESGKIMMGFE
jgi:hypothetical protein